MSFSRKFSAFVVVAELVSLSLAAASASAQEVKAERHRVKSQRQVILEQQRQIEANQRQILAQQAQIARQGAPGPVVGQDTNRGLLGNIGNCPAGTRFTLFEGCLPAVYVVD